MDCPPDGKGPGADGGVVGGQDVDVEDAVEWGGEEWEVRSMVEGEGGEEESVGWEGGH